MRYGECVEQWRRSMEKHETIVEVRIIESDDLGTFHKFANNRGVRNANGEIVIDDNNKNNNIHICIAPYGRNFRGATYITDTLLILVLYIFLEIPLMP